ncbi:Golgi complex component 7-domain-containing protein [Hysterangium stoloniferum]|nr:Golgi complex component 7-domain-containing protein [Hysterangium stoloniferum]
MAQVYSSSSDLIASLEEHADIADWINSILVVGGDGGSITRTVPDVTELATRLEVACQDTSGQLEQSIDDISRTVPRLTYDLHFLRESTLTLNQALLSFQAKLASSLADKETTQALERLTYLDTVKNRMQASRDVLREAESWSTLESEVTSLLSELEYPKAAERLAEASRSMVVFQNTPEYDTRRALMTSLQNQLEAALSSALVAAINARDLTACKNYYTVFANIQRESEFRNYYNGSRRAALLELWTSAHLSDVDGEPEPGTPSSSVKFSDFLTPFLARFLDLVNEERSYAPAIFPDPQQSLSAFIQSTIDVLNPSLSQRLSAVSEHYGPLALPELIKAFHQAEDFAVATDKVLEKVGYTVLFSPSPQTQSQQQNEDPTKPPSHSRRLSKRMSMSRRLGPTRSSPSLSGKIFTGNGVWEQVLFEPFVDLQAEYEILEKKYLEHLLYSVRERSHAAYEDGATGAGARAFRELSVDVFSMAEESLGRCMAFTHGYGAVGLLHALDHLFATFLESARAELLTSSSPLSSVNMPSDAFEELDYSAKDWGTIQLALHLLEACRVVRERLSLLEYKLRTGLVQVASSFRLARSDPQGLYISNTTRGEALLLSQSTLNSADLHALLDALDPGGASATSAVFSTPPVSEQRPASSTLLVGSRDAVVTFAKACQGVLQETLLSPLMQHLSSYASNPIWSASLDTNPDASFDINGKANANSASNTTSRLHIPTFSLSPTPTIQRVAEGLLNLPRLFEVYADDDALAFSVETLPFVDVSSFYAASDAHALTSTSPTPPDQHQHQHAPTHLHHLSPLPSSHPHSQHPSLTPETITSAWLSSLTLTLLSHFTSTILPSIVSPASFSIPTPTSTLSSDLGYLSNVVSALGVEWAELERWREGVDGGTGGGGGLRSELDGKVEG